MENLKRQADDSTNFDIQKAKRQRLEENFDVKKEKVIDLIKREFQNEISKRQEDVHLIQQRLLKAQKTLHLLKYVLIKSFYDRKELKIITSKEESVVNNSDKSVVENTNFSQSRIHPAVKRLIGKKPINYELPIHKEPEEIFIKPEPEEIFEYSPKNENNVTEEPIRNRQKTKYDIIVGNISKYAPSNNPQDSSTHKWMVYVRGPKNNPEVGHIIKKVRFFLHPSYQPNDIIELEESPFHLSRRGWGEFPLRIQIHFYDSFNKPVDIIHNLKLDLNRTGRQTLGNETLINIWLYNSTVEDQIKEETIEDTSTVNCNQKLETISDINIKLDDVNLKNSIKLFENKKNSIQKDYDLIYLVDHCYTKKTEFIDPEKYKLKVPVNIFSSVKQIVYFLFKSLPLVTKLAKDPSYLCCYPYVASSLTEFSSWNYAKRCCSEWFRAKEIKKILQDNKIQEEEEWSIKFIIMFGRAHAFTPLANYTIFQIKNESGKSLPNQLQEENVETTFTEYIPITKIMENINISKKEEDNIIIDVESLTESTPEIKTKINVKSSEIDPEYSPICNYIKKCAAQIKIKLEDEKVEPDFYHNSSEIVLMQSIKCLAEELIRKAWANKVIDRKGRNLNCAIERSDILQVLLEREEFDLFTNDGLGKKTDL